MESKDKYLVLAFFALTVSIVGLAVAGGFRAYSPVPFGDMWGGHLTFFLKATERYAPALMAWAALPVLYAPSPLGCDLCQGIRRWSYRLLLTIGCFSPYTAMSISRKPSN